MGKKCCVPFCHTGYSKYNEKHPMYGVPRNNYFLDKWQEAIARADRPITPNDCVCQKHFKDDDFFYSRIIKGEIERYKVPKLRPDAVPSIFPEFPEAIHGSVKKRRKLPTELTDDRVNVESVFVDVKSEKETGQTNNSSQCLVNDTIKEEVLIKSEDVNDYSEETGQRNDQEEQDTNWCQEFKSNDRFRCERFECNFGTNSKSMYAFHVRTHKVVSDRSVRCTECLFEADSRKKLTIHTKTMHHKLTKSKPQDFDANRD